MPDDVFRDMFDFGSGGEGWRLPPDIIGAAIGGYPGGPGERNCGGAGSAALAKGG